MGGKNSCMPIKTSTNQKENYKLGKHICNRSRFISPIYQRERERDRGGGGDQHTDRKMEKNINSLQRKNWCKPKHGQPWTEEESNKNFIEKPFSIY